jgi:hypothetical protein
MCKIDDVYYIQGIVSWGNDCARKYYCFIISHVYHNGFMF